MKELKNKIIPVLCLAAMIACLSVGYYALAAGGTQDDPLVSLSYIESVLIPRIQEMILNGGADPESGEQSVYAGAEELAELRAQIDALNKKIDGSGIVPAFAPVHILMDEQVIFGEGAEVILRSGRAEAIAPAVGMGLSDATAGNELDGGGNLSLNHLYIISRDDGRGLKMLSEEGWCLIKGKYIVIKPAQDEPYSSEPVLPEP